VSGRDGLPPEPPAVRRYEEEERELKEFLDRAATSHWTLPQIEREAVAWLDKTLAEHRTDARSKAVTEAWRGTWWDRNWFGLAFLGLVAFAMLMIGLVNGWS